MYNKERERKEKSWGTTPPTMHCVFNMASPIAVWLFKLKRYLRYVGLCSYVKLWYFRQEDETAAVDIKTSPETSCLHQSPTSSELLRQRRPGASATRASGLGFKPGAGAECRHAGGGEGGLHHRGGGGSSSARTGARPEEETIRIWPLGRRESWSRFSQLI